MGVHRVAAEAPTPSALRVGFVSDRSMSRGQDGQFRVDAGDSGRVIDALRGRFAAVEVAMSLAPEERRRFTDHRLVGPLTPLPYLPTLVGGLSKGRRGRQGHRRDRTPNRRRHRPVAVRVAHGASAPARRPRRVYHVCADIAQLVRSSPRYSGLNRVPARLLAQGIDLFQGQLIASRRARLIANGDLLRRPLRGKREGCFGRVGDAPRS